ncbi:hypothetical protein GRJ2_002737500 [Grus japonensis]|uniref:Uncharacterized protein n=1 Tax=Grus japonensis TaxID=30415 RepID=A0ABC9XZI8_GRUJA
MFPYISEAKLLIRHRSESGASNLNGMEWDGMEWNGMGGEEKKRREEKRREEKRREEKRKENTISVQATLPGALFWFGFLTSVTSHWLNLHIISSLKSDTCECRLACSTYRYIVEPGFYSKLANVAYVVMLIRKLDCLLP